MQAMPLAKLAALAVVAAPSLGHRERALPLAFLPRCHVESDGKHASQEPGNSASKANLSRKISSVVASGTLLFCCLRFGLPFF